MNAIVYCRESRDDGGERYERIETQRDILLQFCQRKKLTPVHILMDDNKSGMEFERLSVVKKWIETEKIDAFVAKDASRIGRNQLESLSFIQYLEDWGVQLFLEGEQYDEKIFGLFAWLNERRAKEDGEKIRHVLRHKMECGELLIKAPYGYRITDGLLTIVPNQAEKVCWIFERFLSGFGMSELARQLDKAAPFENWSCQKVSRILKNETYCGTYLSGKTYTINHKRQKAGETVIIHNHHPPIIMQSIFDAAQERLTRRKRVANHKYAGRIFCDECGTAFTRRRYVSGDGFVCSTYNHSGKDYCDAHKTLESYLDNEIKGALTQLLTQRESKWRSGTDIGVDKRRMYMKEIQKIERYIERLYEDSLLPDFPRSLFERKLKEYGERKRELEQKLAVQKDWVDVSFPCVEVTKEVLSVVCNRITVNRYGKIKIFVK